MIYRRKVEANICMLELWDFSFIAFSLLFSQHLLLYSGESCKPEVTAPKNHLTTGSLTCTYNFRLPFSLLHCIWPQLYPALLTMTPSCFKLVFLLENYLHSSQTETGNQLLSLIKITPHSYSGSWVVILHTLNRDPFNSRRCCLMNTPTDGPSIPGRDPLFL